MPDVRDVLSAEGLAELQAAGAWIARPNSRDRDRRERTLDAHGFAAAAALFDLDDALTTLRFRASPFSQAGVVGTIEHLASQPGGDAFLARTAARALVPFACNGASIWFLDPHGVVHQDLDLEYSGPVAASWTLWLERLAWEMTHRPQRYPFGILVQPHVGGAVAARIEAPVIARLGDVHEAIWERPDAVVRELRIASRDAGTSVDARARDEIVAVLEKSTGDTCTIAAR